MHIKDIIRKHLRMSYFKWLKWRDREVEDVAVLSEN